MWQSCPRSTQQASDGHWAAVPRMTASPKAWPLPSCSACWCFSSISKRIIELPLGVLLPECCCGSVWVWSLVWASSEEGQWGKAWSHCISLSVGRSCFLVLCDFVYESPVIQLEAAQVSGTKGLRELQLAAGLGWKHGNYSAPLLVGGDFCTQIRRCLSQDLAMPAAGLP